MNPRAFEELSIQRLLSHAKSWLMFYKEFLQGYTPGIKFKVSEALRTFKVSAC